MEYVYILLGVLALGEFGLGIYYGRCVVPGLKCRACQDGDDHS